MSWKRYGKKDANHKAIAKVFEDAGYCILDIHRVEGACDFIASNGRQVLFVEVKSKHGTVRASQTAFAKQWPDPVYLLKNEVQAHALLAAIENHESLTELQL